VGGWVGGREGGWEGGRERERAIAIVHLLESDHFEVYDAHAFIF
jgi:hypothetical protein